MAKHHQMTFGPAPVAKGTQDEAVRPKCTQQADPDEMSAELFDAALTRARITTAEVAYLFGVSESLVRRMRSKNARERVALSQLLRLPPAFHLALHAELNAKYGFGRQALLDLLDAVGRLAVVLGGGR